MSRNKGQVNLWGVGVVVSRSGWSRLAPDLPRSPRAYARQLRPRYLDSDGRWSSQRPSPHGTSDEPLQIRPIGGLDTPMSKPARPLGAGLSRPSGQRDFAPPRGKLGQSSHIGTESVPGILGLSGVSEGFKSLLLHHSIPRFSEISENRSKSARAHAIRHRAWTGRTPPAARIAENRQNLSGRDFARPSSAGIGPRKI